MATHLQQILSARSALTAASGKREQLLAARSLAQSAVAQAARRLAADDPHLATLQADAAKANNSWQDSHAAVRRLQGDLQGLLNQFLGQEGGGDFRRLDAQYPIVLLPIRLETRFEPGLGDQRPVLKIRVYPDEIFADAHEPALTAAEADAGRAYWQASWAGGETLAAWQSLVAGAGAPRAAWIAQRMQPDNLSERPKGDPHFVDPPLRPGVWSRGIEARLLPDRWIAQVYRGGQLIHTALGSPIIEPLVLTLNPNADPKDRVDPYGDSFSVAGELEWTIGFDAAVAAGMALEMLIDPGDLESGFDRLLVFGVRSSSTPEQSSEDLAGLLDAHHYTRGLAFVPQGTPTNNTADKASGYPPPDPNSSVSFAVERTGPLPPADADGPRTMHALGVDVHTADHLAGAALREQSAAQAMNQALFPVTIGYFLEEMARPQFGSEVVDAARDFFLDQVRPRGPLPAFRIGAVPYGILPVGTLNEWIADPNATPAERQLPDLLRRLLPFWLNVVNQVPHVGSSDDPDGDMARILAMEASAREVWVRGFGGKDFVANLLAILNIDPQSIYARIQATFTSIVLGVLGHPEWVVKIMELVNLGAGTQFRFSFVTDKPLSETDPLPAPDNYITQLASATSVDQILASYTDTEPTALLYQLLRHATLRECYRVVFNTLVDYKVASPGQQVETEFHGLDATVSTFHIWKQMASIVPAISTTRLIGDLVMAAPAAFNLEMKSYQGALTLLAALPTAELERLLTETMDVCSHRIDAWITGLYTSRLIAMRQIRPQGTHMGACGWVESLMPGLLRKAPRTTLPNGRQVLVRQDNGGYIHAPTMSHAAAAAVLRNAYLGQPSGNQQRYEINLSSARVRQATFILDSVRSGQPTGAVLGYMFEASLHAQQLDMFIDGFRTLFPLVINPGRDAGLANEAVTARDVVDGLRLRNAFVKGGITFSSLHPVPDAGQQALLVQTLTQLDEVFDSLADLVLSESVYQLLQSRTAAGSAAMDASTGAPAADPDIATQPRGGRSITHRVAMVLGTSAAAPPATTPRAKAEPYLNAWVGDLLGDLSQVVCKVYFQGGTGTRLVAMSELQLDPIDVLSLSRSLARGVISSGGHDSELDRRVRDRVLEVEPGAVAIAITYDITPGAGQRSFPQLLEIARAVADVLSSARALRAEDLMLPQEVPDPPPPAPPDDGRAAAALAALTAVISALGLATSIPSKRAALRWASLFGVDESYPFADDSQLDAQIKRVLEELKRRLAQAQAPGLPATGIAQAIFGPDIRFLPAFTLPAGPGAELALALSQGPSLVSGPRDVQRWFQGVARIREPLGAWRRLNLYAVASGSAALQFELAQLPFQPATRWAGLPYAGEPLPAGLISLALYRAVSPATTTPWSGLLLDEWTEVVPNRSETTAVSFHYENPRAEAAQAVLVAVPPGDDPFWNIDSFTAILNDTIDLAKVRGVDLQLLPLLGQLLPAIYLATDTEDNTISLNFSRKVRSEAQIMPFRAQGGV